MAIIPTILYYLSIFLMIELDARRFGLRFVEIETRNPWLLTRQYWYLLTSLIVIPAFMVVGFTAIKAVFWATIVAGAAASLGPAPPPPPHNLVTAPPTGSRRILTIPWTTPPAATMPAVLTLPA